MAYKISKAKYELLSELCNKQDEEVIISAEDYNRLKTVYSSLNCAYTSADPNYSI